ncbi:hypothetical protein JNM87_03920 [Candidatus Saccharibacteria bacterium]|nr:hypothetical protein [Candidatus Saccharibacteria bacterium]
MALNPVVVEFNAPNTPMGNWRNKLPQLGPRGTKIMIAVVSSVMIFSMISFAVFTIQSNNADFSKKHDLDINAPQQESGIDKSSAALPGGSVATGIGGTSGENPPVVTLTAEPATVVQGKSATLKWSVTNNPKSCVASDDWNGELASSGTETTQALSKLQNYLFTITCKTDKGTGFATVAVSVTSPTASSSSNSSSSGGKPVVTVAAVPALIYAGTSSTIRWEATNSPTGCTASGDWSGTKAGSGSESTAKLTTAKQYTYTITCTNASGTSDPKSAFVTVQELPPDVPLVTIEASPAGPIAPGGSTTIRWSVSNNPTTCTASGDWSGTKAASGSQVISSMSTIKTYQFILNCSNGAGGTLDAVSVQVIPTAPSVSLTVSPSTIVSGQSATITWSATNSPTSCTASGNWSGTKNVAGGTTSTGAMAAGSYVYNLSCTNAGGTGYANNIPLTVNNPSKPVVTLSVSPISVNTGGSANLTWSVANGATSCTATASPSNSNWTGSKSVNGGTASTGALTTTGTKSFTLSCTNAGGTGTATTSVTVSSGGATSPPVVSISASPTSIGTGSSSTLTWSATNSPTSCTASGSWSGAKSASGSASTGTISTAGTYTYTLSCSNAAGSGNKSVSITVIAIPSVTVSVSPATITAGSTTTVSWTTTNSPTSCTAGGSGWSGSKATGGSSQVVTLSSAGTFTFTLSCTNAGGTGTSNTASVTVNAAVYCNGQTPCYSTAQMNAHSVMTDCWGYNTSTSSSTNKSAYNLTNFNNGWHKSVVSILPNSTAANSICGAKDYAAFISGTSLSGVGSHNHQTSTKQNTNGTMNGYRIGYYDPVKP